jgi:RimJ/RimL family protein N-acetyltransferase
MQSADWPAYRDIMASGRAVYMGGPFSASRAWSMFCSDHAQWDFSGVGALMIDDADTGQCLGQVGLNFGPEYPEYEIGWLLYPQAEGRGVAFEAASALKNWAHHVKRVESLVSYIDPQNERSIRLAEKLGGVHDVSTPHPNGVDLVYRYFGRAE